MTVVTAVAADVADAAGGGMGDTVRLVVAMSRMA